MRASGVRHARCRRPRQTMTTIDKPQKGEAGPRLLRLALAYRTPEDATTAPRLSQALKTPHLPPYLQRAVWFVWKWRITPRRHVMFPATQGEFSAGPTGYRQKRGIEFNFWNYPASRNAPHSARSGPCSRMSSLETERMAQDAILRKSAASRRSVRESFQAVQRIAM